MTPVRHKPFNISRSAVEKFKKNFAAHSVGANLFKVCTFRLQNKAVFQGYIIF